MCTDQYYKHKNDFFHASNLISGHLSRDYDLIQPGATNTPEAVEGYVKMTNAYTTKEAIKDMKNLIAQIKQDKIDADEFMEEVGDERIWDYADKTNLEWFEDILKFLEENLQKYYGDEA